MAANRADILTDEDKEILLQRYSDIEWCGDVTHLRCVRCNRVAIGHYVSNCQHLFCNNCRTIFSDGRRRKCPQCLEYVTHLNDQDVNIEMQFIQLKVGCPNKKYGCKHVDEVKNIVSHMQICENTREAALPMEYTGANTFDLLYRQMSVLSEQLRQMSGEMRVMKSESEANRREMQMKMNELELKVDNNMKQLTDDIQKQNEHFTAVEQRGKDERNREVEQLETVRERMKLMETSIRAELTARDGILREYRDQVDEMSPKTEAESLKSQMEEMKAEMQMERAEIRLKMTLIEAEMRAVPALPLSLNQITQVNTEVFEWNIKIDENDDLTVKRTTDVLPLPGYPFGLQVQLSSYTNGKMGVSQRLINICNTRTITTQSLPKIIYVIQDQTDDGWDRKNDAIRCCDYGFVEDLNYDQFIGPWLLVDYSKLLNEPYNKNGSIKIKILVEPPSIVNSFASNDGVLYWRVDNYSERKRMEEEGLVKYQESPYFYTAPQGYRAGALISLNTMMTGVDVYKGKYDDELSQHFKHRITITLFNQTDPSMNLVKSCDHNVLDNVHLHKLCEPSEMENPGYVKNDSMLLKFVVEPLLN